MTKFLDKVKLTFQKEKVTNKDDIIIGFYNTKLAALKAQKTFLYNFEDFSSRVNKIDGLYVLKVKKKGN